MTKSIQVTFCVFLLVRVLVLIISPCPAHDLHLYTRAASKFFSSHELYPSRRPASRNAPRRSHHRPVERQKRPLVVRDKVRPMRNVIPIEIFDWTSRGSFVFVWGKRESLVIETPSRFFHSRLSSIAVTFAATNVRAFRASSRERGLRCTLVLMTCFTHRSNNDDDVADANG